MKIFKSILSLLILFSSSFAMASDIALIQVEGTINPGSASYIIQSVRHANEKEFQALVIELNTPGGLLSSTRDIIQSISSSKIPVAVYVGPSGASATSAGALIALSANYILMAPGTNIGAAHPVGSGGEDVKGAMGDKVTNDTAALARAQAELRGRDAKIAEEIVTKSISHSAEEAFKLKLSDGLASNTQEVADWLRNKINTKDNQTKQGKLVSLPMSLKEKFLHIVADPNISTMLMALGGIALYAEISSGFTAIIPGLFGLFCLLLGFISLQTLPINVGGALIFGLGFCLLIAEAFITSYGLLTVAALSSIFLGGLFLIDPAAGSMKVSLSILLPIVGGIGIILAIVGYILAKDRKGERHSTKDAVIGQKAVIVSVSEDGLSGKLRVNGEIWNFSSKHPVIVDSELTIKEISGLTALV
ncbi:MAG: ATP-dependent Clp protease proteolytic subunit [Oligoflexia bacterium]|nr:ATP-dependent Clp protease proteolytic subunit [Oligoflexia bacterium]